MSKRRPSERAGAHASARPRTKQATAPVQPIELAPPKTGRGRPSTYDPAFCERVIELGEEGKSKAQIARALRVSYRRAHELTRGIHSAAAL